MKKFLRFPLIGFTAVALSASLVSCSDDDEPSGGGSTSLDENKTKIISQYVDNVVVATYRSLADESMALYDACVKLRKNPTAENVENACQEWIDARKYWEQSEAFLYGAAADYNIDPHIDSWPLDKAQLDLALANATLISNMDADGCNFDGFATLGYGLLGFHAVEYVIFRDGEARNYNEIPEAELIYCAAVAEDLRNQCIRLEASWAGMDNITSAKQTILTETEQEPTLDYGSQLELAGQPGNATYKTQLEGLAEMLQGISDIADEVGNTKITDPVQSGNVLDVESWYSWNSIDDFADNILSIKYSYFGQTSDKPHTNSLSNYINGIDAQLDSDIKAAIDNAYNKIKAMDAPFRNNLTWANAQPSIDACNELFALVEEAIEVLK